MARRDTSTVNRLVEVGHLDRLVADMEERSTLL